LSAAPEKEFFRRACTYSRLDARFAAYTRFFAAAAMTNTVLAELSIHRARWLCVSRTTLGTLITLGGLLEVLNARAAAVLEERSAASGLDLAFVEMEQSYIESVLRTWSRSCAPRYHQLITELDSLLRVITAGRLPLPASANIRRYTRVLRTVSLESGRCPSFASCEDRIKIGTALIAEARRPAPRDQPSTTSISLLGKAASSNQSSSSSSTWNTSSSISPAPRKS